ncbi:hypothetical protein MHU86_20409 [Fragilaria crotonensis]|nr:hypothetical protein MHU86_20409 [Fragilaria crotonensis]
MRMLFTIFTFTSVFLLTRLVSSQVLQEQCLGSSHGDNDETTCSTTTAARSSQPNVPPDCTLVMAKSYLDGFGIFTLMDRRRGSPVLPGDIVIQVPDIMNTVGVDFFQYNYWKSAYDTGGMNEGKVVHSVTPGVGMLTNSVKGKSNILPYRVDRDDGDCPRRARQLDPLLNITIIRGTFTRTLSLVKNCYHLRRKNGFRNGVCGMTMIMITRTHPFVPRNGSVTTAPVWTISYQSHPPSQAEVRLHLDFYQRDPSSLRCQLFRSLTGR